MKYLITLFSFVVLSVTFSSCFTTKAGEKAAYLNNDAVFIKGENITAISLNAITMPGDKALYEKITGALQSWLMKKNITSDMRFFEATQNPADIGTQMRQTKNPYFLVLDRIKGGTQKDEMNNDFIVNQLNVYLQKSTGEHIADLTIAIDKITTNSKLANQITDLITGYFTKKNLIN